MDLEFLTTEQMEMSLKLCDILSMEDITVAAAVLEQCRQNGLLIGKGGLYGNCLRVAPPLTLTDEECAEGAAILVDALRAVNAR